MEFELTKQAIEIFKNRYNVKKSLINKIQNKVNSLMVVNHANDYFDLIETIISTVSYINNEVNQFSNGEDKLIIGMSLDDLISYQIERKYKLKDRNVKVEKNKAIKSNSNYELIDGLFYTEEAKNYFEKCLKRK